MMERSGVPSAAIALLLMAVQVHAAEIEPRAYVNTPVGINFLLAARRLGGGDDSGDRPVGTEHRSASRRDHRVQVGALQRQGGPYPGHRPRRQDA